MISPTPTICSIYPLPFDIQFRHDLSVAILHQDKFYAYEESKLVFDRKYEGKIFPDKAFFLGLKQFGLIPADIDHWIFPTPSPLYQPRSLVAFFDHYKAFPSDLSSDLQKDRWIQQHVSFIPHHSMHSGLGYLFTNRDYISLVQDGGGDFGDKVDLTLSVYNDFNYQRIFQTYLPDNLSNFHSVIAEVLRFRDNGKVSGLAAYGKVSDQITRILQSLYSESKGGPSVDRHRFRRSVPATHLTNVDSFDRYKILNPNQGHLQLNQLLKGFRPEHVAATAEYFIQQKYTNYIRTLFNRFNNPFTSRLISDDNSPLFICGGFFNNVSLNTRIADTFLGQRECIFSMAPGDCGLPLGGIGHYLATNQSLPKPTSYLLQTALIGPSFKRNEIITLLDSFGLDYLVFKSDDEFQINICKLISEGSIIGVFVGRAEYGPRSLGSRSIIADPRSVNSKSRLNNLAKRRDWFMPFAPAINQEFLHLYTDRPDLANPFMQLAVPMNSRAKLNIPAGVHRDGTSRIQSVTYESSPFFYQLINAFGKEFGEYCLLNTSFNRHGISTISTPRSAIHHLFEGCVDYLIFENILIERPKSLNAISSIDEQSQPDEDSLLSSMEVI